MKKKTGVIIGIIVAVIISMIGGGIVASGVLDPYEKQIKLGYKMISQEKYEEAILAFNKAIEIDQKKEKAYIGLADTYVARCDENTVNNANDALKRGYEQYQSEKIVDSYINSAQKLYDKDKKDWAIELLEKGYETTKNEKIRAKREEFIKLISFELLDKLFKYCESDNLDEVRKIMNTDEFIKLAAYVTVDSPLLYSPNSSEDNISSKKVGIYMLTSNKKGVPFLYFGNYKDNMRSGFGIWLRETESSSYIFKGNWDSDKPNGLGNDKNIQKDEVKWTCAIETEKNSYFKDGLFNGVVNEKSIYRDGVVVFKYNVVSGILQEDASLGRRYNNNGKEYYYVAEAQDKNGLLVSEGSKDGVLGFLN